MGEGGRNREEIKAEPPVQSRDGFGDSAEPKAAVSRPGDGGGAAGRAEMSSHQVHWLGKWASFGVRRTRGPGGSSAGGNGKSRSRRCRDCSFQGQFSGGFGSPEPSTCSWSAAAGGGTQSRGAGGLWDLTAQPGAGTQHREQLPHGIVPDTPRGHWEGG